MRDLTPIELDSLREVGNVGAGNAATSLSKLISKKVDITIPLTEFIKIGQFAIKAGGPESVVYCIHVQMKGDVSGEALFFFDKKSAIRLAGLMMGQSGVDKPEVDEMDKSALLEMSNIVVGSYLSSLANMLKMQILPEPPEAAYDMLQSVIDCLLAKIGKSSDDVLYVETHITINEEEINGNFSLMFEEKSLKTMLEKLLELYST